MSLCVCEIQYLSNIFWDLRLYFYSLKLIVCTIMHMIQDYLYLYVFFFTFDVWITLFFIFVNLRVNRQSYESSWVTFCLVISNNIWKIFLIQIILLLFTNQLKNLVNYMIAVYILYSCKTHTHTQHNWHLFCFTNTNQLSINPCKKIKTFHLTIKNTINFFS